MVSVRLAAVWSGSLVTDLRVALAERDAERRQPVRDLRAALLFSPLSHSQDVSR